MERKLRGPEDDLAIVEKENSLALTRIKARFLG
jgi:hypothetical protein